MSTSYEFNPSNEVSPLEGSLQYTNELYLDQVPTLEELDKMGEFAQLLQNPTSETPDAYASLNREVVDDFLETADPASWIVEANSETEKEFKTLATLPEHEEYKGVPQELRAEIRKVSDEKGISLNAAARESKQYAAERLALSNALKIRDGHRKPENLETVQEPEVIPTAEDVQELADKFAANKTGEDLKNLHDTLKKYVPEDEADAEKLGDLIITASEQIDVTKNVTSIKGNSPTGRRAAKNRYYLIDTEGNREKDFLRGEMVSAARSIRVKALEAEMAKKSRAAQSTKTEVLTDENTETIYNSEAAAEAFAQGGEEGYRNYIEGMLPKEQRLSRSKELDVMRNTDGVPLAREPEKQTRHYRDALFGENGSLADFSRGQQTKSVRDHVKGAFALAKEAFKHPVETAHYSTTRTAEYFHDPEKGRKRTVKVLAGVAGVVAVAAAAKGYEVWSHHQTVTEGVNNAPRGAGTPPNILPEHHPAPGSHVHQLPQHQESAPKVPEAGINYNVPVHPQEHLWNFMHEAGVKDPDIMAKLQSSANRLHEATGATVQWHGEGTDRWLEVNGKSDTPSLVKLLRPYL